MNLAPILSDAYAGVLDVAVVGEAFGFDARDEYEHFFDEEPDDGRLLWQEGDYRIEDPGYDDPTVVLFHKGAVVGMYFSMMAWLDEAHRGKGLATRMIFMFADRFGQDAFDDIRVKADCAFGFSEDGLRLHENARRRAEDIMATRDPSAPRPAPGF